MLREFSHRAAVPHDFFVVWNFYFGLFDDDGRG